MKQVNNSIRPTMLLGLIITIAMISTALFFQYYIGLEPCPLCSVTRAVVIIMAMLFLIAFIQGSKSWGRRVYGALFTLTSLTGIIISGRHSWVQHFPPEQTGECGPGLNYWMNNLPPIEIIQKVFKGTAECSDIAWTMLGLSIPEWNLIAFIVFLYFSLKLLFTGR